MAEQKNRCTWCGTDPQYVDYHDKVWGVPFYDDQRLFEFLTLEGAQAGLSWITILKRRDAYFKAFDHYDVEKIARYTPKKVEKLLQNEGIIRNRLKIESTITNAQAYIKVQEEFGSFSKYRWDFIGGKPIVNKRKSLKDIPPTTTLSDSWSKDLKKRGFRFVGSTIVYAHMQAVGMVNDHFTTCFRYHEVQEL